MRSGSSGWPMGLVVLLQQCFRWRDGSRPALRCSLGPRTAMQRLPLCANSLKWSTSCGLWLPTRRMRRTGSPNRKKNSGVSTRRARCASDRAGSSEMLNIGATAKSAVIPIRGPDSCCRTAYFRAIRILSATRLGCGSTPLSILAAFGGPHLKRSSDITSTTLQSLGLGSSAWRPRTRHGVRQIRVQDGSLTCPPAQPMRRPSQGIRKGARRQCSRGKTTHHDLSIQLAQSQSR